MVFVRIHVCHDRPLRLIELPDASDLPLVGVDFKCSTESTWSIEANVCDHPVYQTDAATAARNREERDSWGEERSRAGTMT
jgi:hypothetical protein